MHSSGDRADMTNPAGAGRVLDLAEQITVRLAKDSGAMTFVAQGSATASGCCGRPPAKAKAGGSPSLGCAGESGATKPAHDAQPESPQRADLPDTPAGRCAAAFFEAFNSGGDEQMRDFIKRTRSMVVSETSKEVKK